jgi:hypothetical protein
MGNTTRRADQQQAPQLWQAEARMQALACRHRSTPGRRFGAAALPPVEALWRQSPAEITDQCRAEHDQWERQLKRRSPRMTPRRSPTTNFFQRPRADAVRRVQDNRGHRRFDP